MTRRQYYYIVHSMWVAWLAGGVAEVYKKCLHSHVEQTIYWWVTSHWAYLHRRRIKRDCRRKGSLTIYIFIYALCTLSSQQTRITIIINAELLYVVEKLFERHHLATSPWVSRQNANAFRRDDQIVYIVVDIHNKAHCHIYGLRNTLNIL